MAKQQAAPAEKPQPAPAAEGYTVLARRYRPRQFSDLVGQEAVVQGLTNAVRSNRVAHAYLFAGARGVGKTSTARILAKALNCAEGPTPTPCDRCDICRSIASGEDMDVLEIDGASNRGIDEIRNLRSNVQYRPSRARYRIYVIDEVHMLTREAFNALLKTLEEPPAHVKFIFATTDAQRIPLTILSRCQRFDFAGIGTARIAERLRQVVDAEGVAAENDALELIARRAGGSLRDAQSLLDQLLAFGGRAGLEPGDERGANGTGKRARLTADQVHRLLGTASDDRVVELATAVLERNPRRALELLDQAANDGLHLAEVLDQLMEYWRDLMVVRCSGGEGPELSVTARHRPNLLRQAESLELDTILAGLDVLASSKARMSRSSHGRVLAEMALVRLARLDNLVPLVQVAEWLNQGKADGASNRTPPARPVTAATGGPHPAEPPEAAKKKAPVPAEAPVPVVKRADPAHVTPLGPDSLPQLWPEVLAQIGPMLAAAVEKAGAPAISGPNTLVLSFPSGYNHQRESCQEPARVARIEEALRKLTGQSWGLRIESVEDAGCADPPATDNTENSLTRNRRPRAEVEQEPLIQRAADVLEARFVQMDDGFGATPAVSTDRIDPGDSEEA
jgi:DNA polymerase-3 subunit gamma/tau